ncbi:hypothetical protein H8356DRAFT_1362622 [Neocallimastix lanati (nom. inval.)]|nr:hypothetical protein H8356DRAFT_1362622 [Neocallimastix sp. JGI-2020a]
MVSNNTTFGPTDYRSFTLRLHLTSYYNNTLVLRVRDSYYKYQSIKRTEAPACPLAQASCTTRTSDSPTRFIRL